MFDLRGPRWRVSIAATVAALLAMGALGWMLWPR
jgi:hypothetical protein